MVSICSVVYIADNLFDFNANTSAYSSELLTSGLGSQLGCECNLPTTLIGLTVSAFLVIWEWQWYRIISAAFTQYVSGTALALHCDPSAPGSLHAVFLSFIS